MSAVGFKGLTVQVFYLLLLYCQKFAFGVINTLWLDVAVLQLYL